MTGRLEIGKSSVTPWTIARMIACKVLMDDPAQLRVPAPRRAWIALASRLGENAAQVKWRRRGL